uniref:Uncharacterized protein n=1 Tax=Vespula pensylvanica TaxID=30213 RepID=A0A834PDP5_VESPE|nr:hypothetical protein H0235_000031 [Vespula pensylvanica]
MSPFPAATAVSRSVESGGYDVDEDASLSTLRRFVLLPQNEEKEQEEEEEEEEEKKPLQEENVALFRPGGTDLADDNVLSVGADENNGGPTRRETRVVLRRIGIVL